VAYFLAHTPVATTPKDMIAVAGIRWRIEECGRAGPGKDLIDLARHQVRTCTAFHHHVTVCMFAHTFAATRHTRLHQGEHHDDKAVTQGAHPGNDPASMQPSRRQPVAASDGV
jgi:SRSO17 transposase